MPQVLALPFHLLLWIAVIPGAAARSRLNPARGVSSGLFLSLYDIRIIV
jgi:hypothetical protein